MTNKHTPGPWFFEDDGDFDYENVRITSASRARMISIALIEYGSADSDMGEPFQSEQIANTHLIAAAPELLEALQGLLSDLNPVPLTTVSKMYANVTVAKVIAARAAIAKALGESNAE